MSGAQRDPYLVAYEVTHHGSSMMAEQDTLEAHRVGQHEDLPGFLAFYRRIPAGAEQVVGLFRMDAVHTVTGVPAHDRLVVPDYVPDDVPF